MRFLAMLRVRSAAAAPSLQLEAASAHSAKQDISQTLVMEHVRLAQKDNSRQVATPPVQSAHSPLPHQQAATIALFDMPCIAMR